MIRFRIARHFFDLQRARGTKRRNVFKAQPGTCIAGLRAIGAYGDGGAYQRITQKIYPDARILPVACPNRENL